SSQFETPRGLRLQTARATHETILLENLFVCFFARHAFRCEKKAVDYRGRYRIAAIVYCRFVRQTCTYKIFRRHPSFSPWPSRNNVCDTTLDDTSIRRIFYRGRIECILSQESCSRSTRAFR